MHDWRHDPNVQHVTHSDRLGTYEELQVRSVPKAAIPTAPAYKVTYTEGPATFVPAPAPSATVGEVAFYDVPAKYGVPISTDRIDALEREVMRQAVIIAELEAYIRDHSEADDVPFPTLRMAEDAWGVG